MLLLKCAVLLLSLLLIYGEELTKACRLEMFHASNRADVCIEKLQNKTGAIQQFLVEFNEIVIGYSGDEVDYPTVGPLINKFLNIMPQFCGCVLMTFEYSGECPRGIQSRVREVFIKQVATYTYWAQENNGDKIKKLVPHNGLKFLFSIGDIDKCIGIIKDITNMDELCSAIGRAHQCAVQVVDNHPNENVLATIEEIATSAKQANNC